MLEIRVEDHLDRLAREAGGVAHKLGLQGWPDRMVLLPGGVVGFLELKRPGKIPTPLQFQRLRLLSRLGFVADWTDCLAGVELFMAKLREAQ